MGGRDVQGGVARPLPSPCHTECRRAVFPPALHGQVYRRQNRILLYVKEMTDTHLTLKAKNGTSVA